MFPNVSRPYRVFVSVPFDGSLSAEDVARKARFLDLLRRDGFEPQVFGESGLPAAISWSFSNVDAFMGQCQGAVVLGLSRFEFITKNDETNQELLYSFTTEYSHFEGAIAIAHRIPLFIARDPNVSRRGVLSFEGGQLISDIPDNNDAAWSDPNSAFMKNYKSWRDQVSARYHLFLGYSGKAIGTAAMIKGFLQSNGIKVLDWATDFMSGGTILEQIEQANKLCMGGLFLFTKDDELVAGDVVSAAPRDNVIFEAGYFMNSKSDKRVLIIREEGAKMPADLGGQIYLPLKDRNDISPIQIRLLNFVRDRF